MTNHYEKIRKALAHEIWTAAQLAPGEGAMDGVARVEALLRKVAYPVIIQCAAPQQPAAVDGAIDKARFERAPCYMCGYNGPGYYQPDTHPCAAKYHAAQQPAARPPKPTECMNGCPDRQVCDHCQWPPGPDQRPSPPTASKENSDD